MCSVFVKTGERSTVDEENGDENDYPKQGNNKNKFNSKTFIKLDFCEKNEIFRNLQKRSYSGKSFKFEFVEKKSKLIVKSWSQMFFKVEWKQLKQDE